MSRILTLKTLKSKNACREQVVLFRQLFGDSVVVTPELCVKHKNDFDFAWAAKNLLSKTAHDKYYAERNVAYKKYREEKNAAWHRYTTKTNEAWNMFSAERASTFGNAYVNDTHNGLITHGLNFIKRLGAGFRKNLLT